MELPPSRGPKTVKTPLPFGHPDLYSFKTKAMKKTWKEKLLGLDLAVDLGTSRTRVYAAGRGVIADESTAVLYDGHPRTRLVGDHGKVLAVGDAALRDAARGELVRPVVCGGLHDPSAAEALLRGLFRECGAEAMFQRKPRILLVVRDGLGKPDAVARKDIAVCTGARSVFLLPATMAAFVGTGEPFADGGTRMVFDIGAGMAEAALIRNGEPLRNDALRLGADALGPDVSPAEAAAVRELLLSLAARCADAVPVAQADSLREHGVWLTGGGALLPNFADAVAKRTGLPVNIADDPLRVTILGAGRVLEEFFSQGRVFALSNP